jgi:predicted phage terminase large subunit-like protein
MAPSSPSVDRAAVARGGFPAFVELALREKHGRGFHNMPHARTIAEHCEALYRGVISTLLVSCPPGAGKSEIISGLFPAWIWTLEAAYKFMRAGYDWDLLARLGGDTKRLCQSLWYEARWGRIVTDRMPGRQSGMGEYFTLQGGMSKIATIQSGALTGTHAHMMIVDDPLKGMTAIAEDPALLRKAREWFVNVAITRGQMGAKQRMLVTAQRFHVNDLNGLLIERLHDDPEFAHVMLPYHYEARRRFVPVVGKGDPRTVEGAELFDDPNTRHTVRFLRGAGEDNPAYRAQFQQDPATGASDFFPEDTFAPFGDSAPAFTETLAGIFVDPALTGSSKSDFSAIDVIGYRDGRCYVYYSEWVKREFRSLVDAVRRVRRAWPAANVVIEKTANGPALAAMLDEEGETGVVLVTPQDIATMSGTKDGSKAGRAREASFYQRSGRVLYDASAKWFAEKKRHMIQFPHGTHDDMIDSLVMGVIWLNRTYGGGRSFVEAMKGFDGEERTEREEQERRGQVGGVAGQMREAMRKLQEQSKHPVAHEGTITLDYGMLQEAAW